MRNVNIWFLLYLNKKPRPYLAITELHLSFQDRETKSTYVVSYLQKEPTFLAKHLKIFNRQTVNRLSAYAALRGREGGRDT